MKTKRLSYYIATLVNSHVANYIVDTLECQNIKYVTFDEAIHMTHIALMKEVHSRKTVNKIMLRFLDHEVRRNRITDCDKEFYVELYGYECRGCMNSMSNQVAHMDLGGCLFQDENGF